MEELQERLATLKAKYERGGALGEFAYAVLKDAILLDILPEGERLQERYLAEALGLSRTPVREALKRLETEGLVEGLANGGVRIRELTLQDLEDIYELRIVLEGLAARLAAQRASSSDITCLKHLIEQSQTAVDAGKIGIPAFLNAQFHQAIADATRNKHLIELIARFHNSVQRLKYTTLAYPGRVRQALEEHRRLLEAIERRDPKMAEQIAQEHVKHAKEVQIKVYHEKIMQRMLIDKYEVVEEK
jgi:DNA-binding GntR family transcriptional regulator